MFTQQRNQLELKRKLERIQAKSEADPNCVFNNLGHAIDLDLLRRSYHGLKGSRAVGIDHITKEEYGKSLEGNLVKLLKSLRSGKYRPKATRSVEIPKLDGVHRTLAMLL